MARRRISDEQKKRLEAQDKTYQDLVALEMHFANTVEDFEFEIPIDRRSCGPPDEPETSKYNPDGIHDIITFAEHPYFLGQKLHPWQKLILILLYMGIEGNDKLSIDPGNKKGQGCDGCVWKYAKQPEVDSAKMWEETGIYRNAFLPAENSRCLGCTRFDSRIRDLRFNAMISNASTLHDERRFERIEGLEKVDNYESMEDLLESAELDSEVIKQIKSKAGNKFNELLMVLGRRSGKSLIVTIIALYEVYRLLCMGHPQKRYNLLDFDEIQVLNVAVNEAQAKKGIFNKLKPITLSSPYFSQRIGKDLELEIRFLTDNDKKENDRRKSMGLSELDGSIICACGHSNAAGLVGSTNWAVIMDEVASMAGVTKDSGIDYRLYDDLSPTIATFGSDGRIMILSQPKGEEGLLYDLYMTRKLDPTMLIVQLPTWIANPSVPQDWLATQKAKNPDTYHMQYGAEFGSNFEDPFLNLDVILSAFNIRPTPRAERRIGPLVKYYLHVDPATNSDDYALAVCHALESTVEGKPPGVMIDHIHCWEPKGKIKINSSEVEEYIVQLHQQFNFTQVSFDTWNSQSVITNLTSRGINAVCKPFNKQYQEMIFGTMFELFVENRIFIYNINTMHKDYVNNKVINLMEVEKAKEQLKMLQKKWKNNGFKIEAKSGYKDDIPDCIAAAAYECLNNKITKTLPRTRTVNMGR